MNLEIKQKWLEALRSGAYKQTTVRLHKDESFCCLGVLCDLHHKETGNGNWRNYPPERNYYYQTFDRSCYASLPPTIVLKWAGIYNTPRITVDYNGKPVYLDYLNDGRADIPQHSFEEIAQIIEKQL